MVNTKNCNYSRRESRHGFTLIEIMVALAILSLMLLIVFVPVNLGINLFNLGKTNSDVQSAATLSIQQMETDLQQAIYVYPNALIPGVTDVAPYNGQPPYLQSPDSSTSLETTGTPTQVCSGTTPVRASNTARLDMIIGQTSPGSNQVTPAYLVTYYARRMLTGSAYSSQDPQNLMILYRSQIQLPTNAVDLTDARYSHCTSSNMTGGWMAQNYDGEPDMASISSINNRAIALNMALVASNAAFAQATPTPLANSDYQPDTSFTCIDTVGDGKIHRVTIDLTIGQYDAVGAGTYNNNLNLQKVHVKQVVDLPNVR